MTLSLKQMAAALGGEVRGDEVLCPGPGHSSEDRSLAVKPDASGGFICHSFANDDLNECRDHIRQKLGLPPFEAKGNGGSKAWTLIREHVYKTADGVPHVRKRKMLDGEGKRQFPQDHWDGKQWINKIPKDWPRLLYKLPELIKSPTTNNIFVTEGEGDTDTLVAMGTTAGGVSSKWTPEMLEYLKGRRVVIFADADEQGRKYAEKVASALDKVAKSVKLVDLFPSRNDGADVTDFVATDRVGVKLLKAVNDAPDYEPPPSAKKETSSQSAGTDGTDAELERLAKLKPVDYEHERKQAAEKLNVRASILDKLVAAERTRLGLDGADDEKQGHAIEFPAPEPWPEPVDGAELLDGIAEALGRHVIMAEHSRDACALWAAHTFLTDCTMISPRLAFTSPTKGCGKTTALDVMGQLVLRPLAAANVSPSAVFRVIEACHPTLLIDEADSFLKDNEELRGVLNSGHRRGGGVLRTVAVRDDFEVRSFATYGAIAIALIGQLPGTLADRSVPITLTRRKRDEAITSFRLDRVGHLIVLARKLVRWAADKAEAVAATEPQMPAGLYNRAADNWRPLLAIAAVAGGDWLARGHKAALASADANIDEMSRLELLLGDVRDVFDGLISDVDRISSAHLIEKLCEIVPRPWGEYGKRKKPLTQNGLARLLKPLAIKPQVLRIGTETPSGYFRHQFKEAWERFLSSEGEFKPQHLNKSDEIRTSDAFQSSTAETDVEVGKCEKFNNDGLCCGVEVQKGEKGESEIFSADAPRR